MNNPIHTESINLNTRSNEAFYNRFNFALSEAIRDRDLLLENKDRFEQYYYKSVGSLFNRTGTQDTVIKLLDLNQKDLPLHVRKFSEYLKKRLVTYFMYEKSDYKIVRGLTFNAIKKEFDLSTKTSKATIATALMYINDLEICDCIMATFFRLLRNWGTIQSLHRVTNPYLYSKPSTLEK